MAHSLNDYLAGAVGGSAGLIVGHPFETTKVQLQTQRVNNEYKGSLDALSHINKQGLFRGLLRGLSWPLLTYGFVNSVLFGVYGNTLKVLEKDNGNQKPSITNIYIAGCVGGAAQLIPVIPVDYVKVVLQSQIPRGGQITGTGLNNRTFFTGPLQCAAYLLRTTGVRGLYKGGTIMAFRDIPSYGLYIGIYEFISNMLTKKGLTDSKGFFADVIAGGIAGSIGWFSIIPLDVIKSRYQADIIGEYKNPLDCAVKSYRTGGLTIFYRGCLITCLRGFPVNAVTFLVYNQTLKSLNRNVS